MSQYESMSLSIVNIIYRYGNDIHTNSWSDMYTSDFPLMMVIIAVLGCLPPTSVSCETTFSQLKLIKTSRRTRLKSSTLNDIILVKLESPVVEKFDPQSSIDKWLVINLSASTNQVINKTILVISCRAMTVNTSAKFFLNQIYH